MCICYWIHAPAGCPKSLNYGRGPTLYSNICTGQLGCYQIKSNQIKSRSLAFLPSWLRHASAATDVSFSPNPCKRMNWARLNVMQFPASDRCFLFTDHPPFPLFFGGRMIKNFRKLGSCCSLTSICKVCHEHLQPAYYLYPWSSVKPMYLLHPDRTRYLARHKLSTILSN